MRRLPFLSRGERRALLLLEWLLVLALVFATAYFWRKPASSPSRSASPADSSLYNTRTPAKDAQPSDYIYGVPEEPVETFPFDPNTADSTQLLRLGLAPWQVRAIYRYRARHGRYHTPDDFKRLPGMTGELWERLGPYVRIAERFRYLEPSAKPVPRTARPSTEPLSDSTALVPSPPAKPSVAVADSVRDTLSRPEKFPSGTVVDINEADTNVLKRIPGIASYRAGKIVEYRQRLGGYIAPEQAMEACEMPDEVLEWFTVGESQPSRLDINQLTVRQLMRHPYISFYQARDIVEYRKKHGPFASINELHALPSFTDESIERLRPYLECK